MRPGLPPPGYGPPPRASLCSPQPTSSLCVQVRPSQPSRQMQENESPVPTHVPPFTQGLGRQLLFWAVKGREEKRALLSAPAVEPLLQIRRCQGRGDQGQEAGGWSWGARLGDCLTPPPPPIHPPMLHVLPFQPGGQAQRKVSPLS